VVRKRARRCQHACHSGHYQRQKSHGHSPSILQRGSAK
jgi:hypothetical protein